MSKFIYVSTDSLEVQSIVEPETINYNAIRLNEYALPGTKYKYHQLDKECSEGLEKEIGFYPNASIELDSSIKSKEVGNIIGTLLNNELFAAVDANVKKTYKPKDFEIKTKLLQMSLNSRDFERSNYLFMYSKNPDKIIEQPY